MSNSEEEGLNYVKGRIGNKDIQLLLDMGAQVSVMPEEMQPKLWTHHGQCLLRFGEG